MLANFRRIHILGASGSGTTTLGQTMAEQLKIPHYDTDDFYWLDSVPPFHKSREETQRQILLGKALKTSDSWILSGSLCGWGDRFIADFDLVVFLWLPRQLRLSRLRQREMQRYGFKTLSPSGKMHQQHRKFLEWAAAYDDGGYEMRSLCLHRRWLNQLPCKVVECMGDLTTQQRIGYIFQECNSPS